MSFAIDLWDKFDAVSRHSVESRKLFEEFSDIFEERAQAEEIYSKSMEKLTIQLQKLQVSRTQGVQNVISSLKTNFMNRAEQSKVLSEQFRAEILPKQRQMAVDQNSISKRLLADGKKLEKDLRSTQDIIDKVKMKYLRSQRELENHKIVEEILKLSPGCSVDKRDKQAIKTKQQASDVKDLESLFKFNIHEFNKTLSVFFDQMDRIMSNLQDYECERINQMKDAVMKNIIFETSYLKNIEYDIDNISEKLNQVDASRDIIEIIERSPMKKPRQEALQFDKHASFIGESITYFQDKSRSKIRLGSNSSSININSSNIEEAVEQYVFYKHNAQPTSSYIDESLTAEVRELVDKVYIQYTQLLQEEYAEQNLYQQIEDLLKLNPLIRSIWTFCLSCIDRENIGLSKIQFFNIANTFNTILDHCWQSKDSITSKRLLVTSFSLFSISENANGKRSLQKKEKLNEQSGEKQVQRQEVVVDQTQTLRVQIQPSQKVYLQSKFGNHAIVKSKDFWESCAFESVVSELQTKYERRLERKEHFDPSKDKSIIEGQLQSISHVMLIFDYDIRELKDILTRFSRLFGLSEEQLNDLLNIVDRYAENQQELNRSTATTTTSSEIDSNGTQRSFFKDFLRM